MAKAFWPGYRWRILAHCTTKMPAKERGHYTGHHIALNSQEIQGPVEFDELVIDDWFHLEQMGDRNWWIGVGNGEDYWHVNVRIDGKGQASVRMEKQ